MAGSGNKVEISISANDNVDAGIADAEAKFKAMQAPNLKIQAQLEADHLKADADAAAAKAHAKITFEADMSDAAQIKGEAERAAAEAQAKIKFEAALDSADLKAKADIAAAEAKAEIKFKAVLDKASTSGLSSDLKKAADDGAKEFGNDFQSSAGATPWFGIAIGAGIAVGLPLAAGAVATGAAAIMAGFAGYLDKNIPMVSTAWSRLGTDLASEAHQWAAPLAGPISDALNQINGFISNESGTFASMFASAGKDIAPLVQGIEGLVSNTLPGLNNMIGKSQPIMEAMGALFSNVGSGLSAIFNNIAADAPQISTDIRDFGQVLLGALKTVGDFISITSKIGVVVLPVFEGLANLIPTISNAFNSEFNGKGIVEVADAAKGLGEGLIRDKQSAFDLGQSMANVRMPDSVDRNIQDIGNSLNYTAYSGDLNKLQDDMQKFGDATQTTQTRVSAFVDFLKGIGQGGAEAVNSFVAAATLDLDNFAKSMSKMKGQAVDSTGGIEQFTQAGAKLQEHMVLMQGDIGSIAQSMHDMGASSDQVTAKIGTMDSALENNLIQTLHITKQQADGLISQFNLWPDQLLTHINAADGASVVVQNAANEIMKLNGMTATVYVQARANIQNIIDVITSGYKAAGGPVTHHAAGMPLTGYGVATINEMGPETLALPNGTRVIPNANTPQEQRNAGKSSSNDMTMTFAGDVSSAFAVLVMNLIRSGQVTLNVNGQRVRAG